ncbi:hypothetical protein B0T10DRAFT_210941 [Thelonectria olida]|uniref:MARVEL domain-containing protein n=1 Tax=Thelonectria olida TaxID=1576542 RepID=A0A9P8WBS4_9HYPO|nr:hypothetical protein B0T10DRAFT_210941 [Thelonectria olida]
MSTTTSGTQGLTATGVPAMPVWLTIIRGVIIAFALGALIASAYNLSLFGGNSYYLSGYSGPAGFMIFDAIFTWLILGFMLASEFFAPQLYIRIAFIGALILCAIFWLSAWAWAASVASSFYSWYDGWYSDNTFSAYGGSMAAAAAIGAVTWVLVIVFIVFFVRACIAAPQSQTFPPRNPNEAELGESKPPHHEQPMAA